MGLESQVTYKDSHGHDGPSTAFASNELSMGFLAQLLQHANIDLALIDRGELTAIHDQLKYLLDMGLSGDIQSIVRLRSILDPHNNRSHNNPRRLSIFDVVNATQSE